MSSSSSSINNTVDKDEKQVKEENDGYDCSDYHRHSNESTSLLKNEHYDHLYYDNEISDRHGYENENEQEKVDEESMAESAAIIQQQMNIPSKSISVSIKGYNNTNVDNSIDNSDEINMEHNKDKPENIVENNSIAHTKEDSIPTKKEQQDVQNDDTPTYFSVIRHNRPFQLYLLSYIITLAGEWFTYVASIELMEKILNSHHSEAGEEELMTTSGTKRRYVSYLVIFRLLPFLIISPFGGVLADIRDRRHSMITLDVIGFSLPLLFLLFMQLNIISIPMIFTITALQSTVEALYEPCRSAIIPLFVPDDEEMMVATTLVGLAWSVIAALSSALGGIMVGQVGIEACFALDSISFILSALILVSIGGEWDASAPSTTVGVDSSGSVSLASPLKSPPSLMQVLKDMIIDGALYIKSSKFWPLVLVKVTASIIFGSADVLNVSFSEEVEDGNGNVFMDENDEAGNSQRLGSLFFCVGFGCMIGPIIADYWKSMEDLMSILNSCIISFAIEAVGCLGIGYSKSFHLICFFTVIRAAGSSIAWIDSSVLLQTYSEPDMLGRVVAVDYMLSLTGESFSAWFAGMMQDDLGYTAREVSLIMGYFLLFLFMLWLIYRLHNPMFESISDLDKGPQQEVQGINSTKPKPKFRQSSQNIQRRQSR